MVPEELIAFSGDLEHIEQFLDRIHEIAVAKAIEGMRRKSRV